MLRLGWGGGNGQTPVNGYRSKKKLLTLEELYVEILYTILHMLGCDKDKVLVHHLCSVCLLCSWYRMSCSSVFFLSLYHKNARSMLKPRLSSMISEEP
jgi:hypothetical protein